MKVASIIFIGATMLSFGQTMTKKATQPAAKSDTWQKSKECSSQAEKMIAEWPRRTGSTPTDWNNHYSPKYGKCFVSLFLFQASQDDKVFPSLHSTSLFDAFERSPPLATSCTVLGHPDCAEQIVKTYRDAMLESVSLKLNGKAFAEASAAEKETVRTIADRVLTEVPTATASFCGIDGKAVDCAKAASFISEHMRN